MNIKKHIIIKGKVQGVGFRYWLYKAAVQRNINGWVRNKISDEVEDTVCTILASGQDSCVMKFRIVDFQALANLLDRQFHRRVRANLNEVQLLSFNQATNGIIKANWRLKIFAPVRRENLARDSPS